MRYKNDVEYDVFSCLADDIYSIRSCLNARSQEGYVLLSSCLISLPNEAKQKITIIMSRIIPDEKTS